MGVASSYADDQQMSHTDYHQKTYENDQWAKATGQDISQNHQFESTIATTPTHATTPLQQPPTPSQYHDQYDNPATPISNNPDSLLHQPMTPQAAPETPLP